jgi:hypothetical protein
MKIEILYVADCPGHSEAVKLVKNILATEGMTAEIREVLVGNEQVAKELRFRGSPTIRVNGRDVAGEVGDAEEFALSCRLYAGSKQIGLPPSELVHQAIVQAQGKKAP